MAGKFELEGVEAFSRGIASMLRALDNDTRIATTTGAAAVAVKARQNAQSAQHGPGIGHIPGTGPGPNVMTGHLLHSISSSVAHQTVAGVWEAEVGARAFYAPMVEARYPFLASAVRFVEHTTWPITVRRAWGGSSA